MDILSKRLWLDVYYNETYGQFYTFEDIAIIKDLGDGTVCITNRFGTKIVQMDKVECMSRKDFRDYIYKEVLKICLN